jgi:alpha-tubulin suppressor-like RCC1 family protein
LFVVCAVAACRYHFDDIPRGDGGGDANDLAMAGRAIQIDVGESYACAVHETGRVSCWGTNENGQLGNATLQTQGTPLLVEGIDDAVEVSAGSVHTCARRTNGAIKCWGNNGNGRLGNGSASGSSPSPVDVVGITDAVQLAVGYEHACVRRMTGQVACWGLGDSGELGDGNATLDGPTPVTVSGIADAIDVSAGGYYSCAVRAGGGVQCWGYGFDATMGNGTFTSVNPLPVNVSNITDAVDVEAGIWFACARRMGGAISCWGGNFNGELGLGITADHRTTPVALAITGATQLALGPSSTHACARLSSGLWSCWGLGSYGELGNGMGITSRSPVATSITDEEVSVGGATTCGRTGGTVHCWGLGSSGQSGDCLTFVHDTPVEVAWLAGARMIAAGDSHMCAINAGGSVFCAGLNEAHLLGNGSETPSMTSVATIGGAAEYIAASGTHTCITNGGIGACWGTNYYGELGDGTTSTTGSDPVPVSGLVNLGEIQPGDGHTCARDTGNNVSCWGINNAGQLGDGTMTARTTKALATGVTDAIQLASSASTSCIYRVSGVNACWGDNGSGTVGDGTTMDRTSATSMGGTHLLANIAVSYSHGCGVFNGSEVWCWGQNNHGGLGDGTTNASLVPVRVVGINDAVLVAVNYDASCAIRQGGVVSCWGAGALGQLGNGERVDHTTPVVVTGVTGVLQLSMAANYACARTPNQTYCWGHNSYGQFGDGTESIRLAPGPAVIGLP